MFLIVKVSFLNALKFCRTLFVVARCVGAKANVLHCVGFERGDAALLILLKRWHFVFHFSVRLMLALSSFRVRHNDSIYEPTLRLLQQYLNWQLLGKVFLNSP